MVLVASNGKFLYLVFTHGDHESVVIKHLNVFQCQLEFPALLCDLGKAELMFSSESIGVLDACFNEVGYRRRAYE